MSVALERSSALLDVQRTSHEYGHPVTVYIRGESGVVRDTYQTISQFTQAPAIAYSIYAFPIRYDPTQRELEQAGIYERCDVLIWTATKDWTDLGLSYLSIDEVRSTVVLDGAEYRVGHKQQQDRFFDVHLHIALGLTKRE